MLKHNDILGELDPLRKVALVSSAFGDEALTQAGLPAAGKKSLAELGREKGVSYPCAARAWNAELFGKMTEELAAEAGAEGAKLFVSPDLKAAVDPYREGLSEDPCLNGAYGAAILKAVHAAGGAAALSALSLDADEISFLDRRENAGAVHDLTVSPFLKAVGGEPCDAIVLTPNRGGAGYAETNRALLADVTNGYFGKGVFAVADGVSPTADSISLLRGGVVLGGAGLPLERAALRYRQLAAYLEEGSVSARDLEDAVREGSALSEERLDEAADEAADFALRLAERVPAGGTGDGARRKMAEECIVLLRNRGVLPLAAGSKIAVVGEAYADLSALEKTFTVTGKARGYDRATDRSDALIPEAVRATNDADAVLLFLHLGETGRSLAMPANRLALLDALVKTGRKVIALVCGDLPADMSFDSSVDATLAVPGDGPFAGEALARVLAGETDPSGRLSRTPFDGADGYYRVWKSNRDTGRMRVGSFIGYMRYDTAGERIRYPFGFGLSYTTFSYSGLSLNGDKVSFTLKNTGKRAGSEVVQVYIGAPSVSHVSPKKKLAAFRKVSLRAGESKRIAIALPPSAYATFDPRTLTENVEKGVYRVYVCSSSLDVKLTGKRTLGGTEREKTEETPAEFFPGGDFANAKNVRKENRLGNAYTGKVPQKLKTVRKAALFALPALAYLFFFLITMLIFSYALDYAVFFALDANTAEWALYILAVAALGAIPLFCSFNRKRLMRWKTAALVVCPILMFVCFLLGFILIAQEGGYAERIALRVISCFAIGAPLSAIVAAILDRVLEKYGGGVNGWAKYYLEREPEAYVTPETEFEEAFRVATLSERAERRKKTEEEQQPLPLPDVPQFYDRHLDFGVMLRDCKLYAQERGLEVGESVLRAWLGALVSAQLIITAGDGARLCETVAEYFGKKAYIDNGESYARGEDLFTHWRQSERMYVQTEFSAAIASAKRETAYLHTVLIRHADPVRVMQALAPVAAVFARRKTAVTLPDGTQEVLPPNLRLVVEIEKDRVERLPAGIAEVAAVLVPKCKAGEISSKKTVLQTVGFERFTALRQTVRDEYPLGDKAWKNVDALDARCRAAHVGNLLWVRTELHASVAVACGASEEEALDESVACELLPWIAETWKEEECGGPLRDALTEIFGLDGSRLCEEALKERKGGDGE